MHPTRSFSTWIVDITVDTSLLTRLTLTLGGYVTYGNNNKGKIVGSGDIEVKGNLTIQNVILVEGLKYNVLSISQLCDKGLQVTFQLKICLISVETRDKLTLLVKGLTMCTCLI